MTARTLAAAVADAAAAQEQQKLKTQRMRRFTWCRTYHSMLDEPRWRLVARMSGAPVHLVEAFVVRLDVFASGNRPRGSLEGFSVAALAAQWNIANDEVLARIYAALEEPEVGWIEQDHLQTFWERNPDVEDPTNADRQQRHRQKVKERKEAAKRDALSLSTVTRYGRYVTNRPDLTIQKEPFNKEPGGPAVHSESGDSGENRSVDPELWLATVGERIVIERLTVVPARAKQLLERWLVAAGESHAALAEIIAGADRADYVGARFHNLAVDGCKRQAASAAPQLPLRPVAIEQTKRAVNDD